MISFLLDMICLQIAFLLAYVIRHDSGSPYIVPLYRNMAIFMELLDIIVMFFYETLSNVFETGIFQGVCSDGKACALCGTVLGAVSVYDAGRSGVPRTAPYLTGVIYAILTYIVRSSGKKFFEAG